MTQNEQISGTTQHQHHHTTHPPNLLKATSDQIYQFMKLTGSETEAVPAAHKNKHPE
jgi:hypothetical protein